MREAAERVVVQVAREREGTGWQVKRGEEIDSLSSRLPSGAADRVIPEAIGILERSLVPGETRGSRTGLAVGFIQSGKTMSFTTVAALARDNGIAMVIVVAGISELLLGQSRDRLETDLDLQREGYRRWQHFKSPDMAQRSNISDVLREWRDPGVPPRERPTVLVTVMKNAAQLRKLAGLLERLDLSSLTALLIDDEADQASLNTRWRKGEESSIYFQLLRVRAALPRHTLLQYTATPQGPLLLSLADSLSPDFTSVLSAGPDYVGGQTYFAAGSPYARVLPQDDVAAADNPPHEPPEGLLHAMRVFFLGVVAGQMSGAPEERRSMMIHPSRLRDTQAHYLRWVRATKDFWREVLDRSDADASRQQLLADFARAHAELAITVATLPPLDEMTPVLSRWIRRTKIQEVNAANGRYTAVDWKSAYSWILVGGQLLDRGFTVEGLTVTYMPRDIGVGNADTLQQRARFYGYKRSYLPYCRVWLEPAVRSALEAYVLHENRMHAELTKLAESGKPLREWRRALLLDPTLRPTRSEVLSMPHQRFVPSEQWLSQDFPHARAEATELNRVLVSKLKADYRPADDPGDGRRTRDQIHAFAEVPLLRLLTDLLTEYVIPEGNDSIGYTALLLQVSAYLDGDPTRSIEPARVYWMSGGLARERSLGEDGGIAQLFQGANPNTGYPGDRDIRFDGLSVQIHNLTIKRADGQIRDVPALAAWLPKRMRAGAVIQAG